MTDATNHRILLIDDTPSIHEDFRKILGGDDGEAKEALADAKAAFFGGDDISEDGAHPEFELDSAYQGQEGLEKVLTAKQDGRPYAMAFVDVRMPPGWDGIQTIKQLWKTDPDLQIVICTAYSDYSWDQTIEELGQSDRLLILKKPFDSVEIRQLAAALTEKWNAAVREKRLITELRSAEAEARAYASSLETMNQALMTANATSERASEVKTGFLASLSTRVNANLTTILDRMIATGATDGLEEVLDSSRELMRTLDRVLDLTEFEAGVLTLEPGPCRIVELVQSALEARRPEADIKGLALRLDLPAAIPEAVECDERRLREILDQLLQNAIRHTDAGNVVVNLTMEPTSSWQESHLRIEVRDTGSGIPGELEGRLYEPFVTHGSRSKGVGLGLAMTRNLARMMGGDATHECPPDGGTAFAVKIAVGNISGVKMVG